MILSIPEFFGWNEYTPVIPKFYWDVYSQEQRIKEICLAIDKLENYANMLADSLNKIHAVTPQELKDYKTQVNKRLQELKNLIDALQTSALIYDVQRGEFLSSVESQRDMFKDLSVKGLTVEQFNALELTVESLANCGLNCRGLAVIGEWLQEKFKVNDIYLAK